MTPERLRQVANVLDVVLELEVALRPAYLSAVTANDPDLRREVERHLGAPDGGAPDGSDSGGPTPEPRVPSIGERVGPYRVVEHLGVGGMGTVYLAEREDEHFERRVAVKVLRAGFESPELVRRFIAERQILARLEHPNIARLYEGGATADGRPFLVMEYVDGRPIDRYCDEEKLGVAERVDVMRKVCGAVQYAHRHLVVHRDLKPSNILVGDDGEPKLLDFGIAKLLDPGSFPMTVEATRTGLSPMTPHYASPEQVRGEAITTATDVYALGVLLYRLLAGRLPYHFESGARNHILQVLEQSGPTRPSQVILEEVPENRDPAPLATLLGIPRAELRRTLVGDLDSIALKALRPEAGHRYPSPEHLAADLERHRAGLPVQARQGTWRYRVGKFIRRHRVGVGLATSAVLLLTALSIFMTRQASVVAEERNAALAAR
ncbi:MAG: serine/threonine-protein kinase, partial [Acidobacteriota bacterium]